MLECQTSDGKWPLDIIIPSLDRLWKPVVDSSLPLEAAEKLKRGDEVIAKDSRGRRLAANVVSVSATPHHASTGVVDSLPVLLRFRFAGKQWEEQCSVDLRDIIILPPPSTQGELEIVKLLQDRLIDPVDEGTSFSRKRQSLFNILIESKSISNAVSSGNSMNPPSNSVNVNSSSRQSDNTSTRSSTARDSLVSGLLSTVSAMVPFGAGRISASLPGNRLSKGSNSTQISSPAVVSPSEESLVLASGFTGLYNVGNTCYLNASLQALSHAPLLPPYFLSGRFRKDLNRSNILGTGGRLAEEFANLEQLMWSVEGSYRIVSPMEFKRVLQRSKPQFSGNDQQDSQEFLAELLDALHEDLNRFDRSKESRKLRLDSTLSQESFKKLVHYDASVDQVGNMKQLSITVGFFF